MASKDALCSVQTLAAGLNPHGSAPSYSDYLLVTWPLPWPRDAKLIAPLGELQALASELPGRTVRIQLLVPTARPTPEVPVAEVPVAHWHQPPGTSRGFSRQDRRIPLHRFVPGCLELLAAPPAPAPPPSPGSGPAPGRTVVVCGHGSRDRCCGQLGTRLLAAAATPPEGVELRRTSHLGGHRFAPTALSFPEGAYWGQLDHDGLRAVLEQGDVRAVAGAFRGTAGVAHPGAQLLEATLLAEEGWASLAYEKGVAVAEGPGGEEVTLSFTRPDGSTGGWRGVVEVTRQVQLTVCGGTEPGELVEELGLAAVERVG